MTLIRWTPFRELIGLQEEMNRLFTDYSRRSPEDMESGLYPWFPLVDISENENEIFVSAEIPGMNKEDIKINLQENVLTLKGEKRQEGDDQKKNFHRIERTYGSFERSFSLPTSIQVDKVKATYKDGLLTILLPKAEEVKPKAIEVNVK